MLLLDLPEELLIMIIRKLDVCALCGVYNTCTRLRSVVCMRSMITHCCLSRNTLATVNTFQRKFFKDISHGIVDLNMCGVPDLHRTQVLKAMKTLKQLKVLDISFTKLDILDLLEIYKVCPTIKDITVNLQCGGYGSVPVDIRLKCQNMFKNFENVHFVGSLVNLLCSKFIVFILAKSKLHHLKYTRTETSGSFVINDTNADTDSDEIDYDDDDDEDYDYDDADYNTALTPQIDQFTAFIMNWKHRNTSTILNMHLSDFPVLSMFNVKNYEYVVISIEEFNTKVYATPIFNNYFKEMFDITVERSKYDMKLSSNMAVMVWYKAKTNFNDSFYKKLSKSLKQYLPYYFQSDSEEKLPVSDYDWFYTMPGEDDRERPDHNIKRIGNKRMAVCNNLVLNYDTVFEDKDFIEISFVFKKFIRSPVALTAECDYLRKLTYLSFINIGRYSLDFFNILFVCCVNLKTLNVEGLSLPPCASTIARYLPLSQSLNNLRLVDRDIDFSLLFTSITQCPSLQNVHIVDRTAYCGNVGDPTFLIQHCRQLYSIYISGDMSASLKMRTSQKFRRAKKRFNKHYINVVVKAKSETSRADCTYDTFIDVFRLNPIRPLLK